MPLPLILAGIEAASGLAQGISGLFQSARAKKLASQNVRPVYQIPDEIKANKELAQIYANQGMPSEQMAQAQKGIGRSQAASLAASADKRGGLATIAGIQDASQNAQANLAAQSAAMRMQNIRGLMGANAQLAQYRDKAFDYNQAQKYQENAAAARALQAAGTQNIQQGLSGFLSGASTGLSLLGGNSGGKSAPNSQIQSSQLAGLNNFIQNRPSIDTTAFQQSQAMPPVFQTRPIEAYKPSSEYTSDSYNAANDIAGQSMFGGQGLLPFLGKY